MVLNLEIWSVLIGLMELGCALTWNHDEQFVEGDFPYYPYTNRFNAYADTGDSLTDARIRSNEFSGYKMAPKRRHYQGRRKPLYAFNKDSNKLIDATKLKGVEPEVFKPVRGNLTHWQQRHFEAGISKNLNSAGLRPNSSRIEDVAPSPRKKPTADAKNSAVSRRLDSEKHDLRSGESARIEADTPLQTTQRHVDGPANLNSPQQRLTSAKSKEKDLENGDDIPANSGKASQQTDHQDVKSGNRSPITGRHEAKPKRTNLALRKMRKRRHSGFKASLRNWKSRNISEPHAKDLWAHGLIRNTTPIHRRKFTRENKPGDRNRKLTLVAPYETNFTGGGFRAMNPSSWLAKEIERFIRRKDHRWLDFMKNAGMDVKKQSTVVSQGKAKSDDKNTQITPCVNCLAPSSAPNHQDGEKLRTDLLINRIDSLLADLNQFRSSVKNGWSDMKKTRETETGQKLMDDEAILRKHRLRRGIRFRRKRPSAGTTPSDLVENDLQDLKKNVVLYRNRLSDDESQALKDLKLHIKVYVAKGKQSDSRHTGDGEFKDYEPYSKRNTL